MTTTTEPTAVALDDLQGWIDMIDQADAKIAELEQVKKQARAQIETRLGDAELGTVNGRPRVRWTVVTSNRLDQKKLKAEYPDLAEACTTTSISRRFTLVKDGD